jgi:hypothetical protein
LSEKRLVAQFEGTYERVVTFNALDTTQPEGGDVADYKGFLFDLRKTG